MFRTIKENNFKELTIIEVPNLRATVYRYKEKHFTSYNGRSVREALSESNLMKLLKVDAVQFQKKYGDKIKNGRLLN